MLDFLGLPWDPSVLRFDENTRAISTASKWQVRQPLYKSSLERWRPYRKHLAPLIDALEIPAATQP